VSVEVAPSETVPRRLAPGSVIVTLEGRVLSIQRLATTAEVLLDPGLSTATARKSYWPSVSVVVSSEQLYGEVVSAQTSVQVPAPAGERWIATEATPLPSEAVAPRETVPRMAAPGSVIVTVGPPLLTFTPV